METEPNDHFEFHAADAPGRCFYCAGAPPELLVVRQTASMKLIHTCAGCLLGHLDAVLLDNTRKWPGPKRGG